MYQEYDEKTLQKLQRTILSILKYFVVFCEENKIDYFLVGGSAIGAVRHQGIIPWDDDIDIGFDRKNYDKFLKLAKKKLDSKYEIINAETIDNYPLMTTRLIIKDTVFKEECFKNLNIDLGIFLDLYCFDNIPDNNFKMKIQGYKSWFWSKILILKYIKKPVLYFSGIKYKIISFICTIIHYFVKYIPHKYIYNRALKNCCKYKSIKTKRIGYYFDPTPFKSIIDKKYIFPTRYCLFNNIKIKIPKNIDKYLTKRYGDYMVIPPIEKRHNHPPYKLIFNKKSKDN